MTAHNAVRRIEPGIVSILGQRMLSGRNRPVVYWERKKMRLQGTCTCPITNCRSFSRCGETGKSFETPTVIISDCRLRKDSVLKIRHLPSAVAGYFGYASPIIRGLRYRISYIFLLQILSLLSSGLFLHCPLRHVLHNSTLISLKFSGR